MSCTKCLGCSYFTFCERKKETSEIFFDSFLISGFNFNKYHV